jgi:GNAT superfamily N-acetyltransferase
MPGENQTEVLILPFRWEDWEALRQLRDHQLQELGISPDPNPNQSDLSSPYEQDYHRLDQVYQKDNGNFWIARLGKFPVGHIGAQDMETHIELRRMYVRKEYRRLGVGTQLVQTLIDHCCANNVNVIELWTDAQGPGRFLYEKLGICEVENNEAENRTVSYQPLKQVGFTGHFIIEKRWN